MRTFFAKYGSGAISLIVGMPLIFWIGMTYGILVQLVTAVIFVIVAYGFGRLWGHVFWREITGYKD